MDKDDADSELERRVLPDIPSVDIPSVDTSDAVENPEEELVPEPGSRTNAGRSTVDGETKRRFAGAAAIANILLLTGGIGLLFLVFEGLTTVSVVLLSVSVLSAIALGVAYRTS